MAAKNAIRQEKPSSRFFLILVVLLLFDLMIRLVNLGHPDKFYFDEVYHGFTATQYYHGNPQAYDPWAKPPDGVAFEWTHPPLAKLIMAGMLAVFGENAFAWRVGSVFFGVGAIGLTSLLAWELFASETLALLAGFLLSFEGLFFVQSRIAMNDTYFVFFALAALIFYVRWKKAPSPARLAATGACLGLAATCKWTTLYVFVILGIDLLREWLWVRPRRLRLPWIQLFAFLLALPAAIYLLSYAQMFALGYDFEHFKKLQQQMWWYHSNLKATHSYQSVPWQWILNLRPVWMYAAYPDGMVQNIYNIGNSVILISGLAAAAYTLFVDRDRSWQRWFLLLCYFMLWLPWSISPRIMLFYHYMPAVPFLCILLARSLTRWMERRPTQGKPWTIGICTAAVIWFALFYPHMTAVSVSKEFANRVYFALPGWK